MSSWKRDINRFTCNKIKRGASGAIRLPAFAKFTMENSFIQSNNKISISLLVSSALCLSIGTVMVKALIGRMPPFSFIVVQLCASIVFLWIIILFQKLRFALGESVLPLVLVGCVVGTGSVFTILALKYISASQASLIFAIQPVLIMAFAWFLIGERPKIVFIVLGILAVVGVIFVIGNGASFKADNGLLGSLFAFLSTAFAAVYVVWMRKITSVQNPLIALAMLQTTSVIVAIFAWLIGKSVLPQASDDVSMFDWVASACTGIIYYGLAFWLYLKGLQKISASIAGLYLNLVPVFTISLAFILLGESLTIIQWVGAIIVFATVLVGSSLIVREEISSKQ